MKNLQRITLFPYYAIRRIYHCYLQRYNPRKYAKILHRCSCGRELDLEHPQDLNEKINWMKFIKCHMPTIQSVQTTRVTSNERSRDLLNVFMVDRRFKIPSNELLDSFLQ